MCKDVLAASKKAPGRMKTPALLSENCKYFCNSWIFIIISALCILWTFYYLQIWVTEPIFTSPDATDPTPVKLAPPLLSVPSPLAPADPISYQSSVLLFPIPWIELPYVLEYIGLG